MTMNNGIYLKALGTDIDIEGASIASVMVWYKYTTSHDAPFNLINRMNSILNAFGLFMAVISALANAQ